MRICLKMKHNRPYKTATTYVVLAVLSIIVLSPILWSLSTSLKTEKEVQAYPPRVIPRSITLESYYTLFAKTSIPRYLLNSVIVAVFTVALTLVIASFAAYSFARFNFPGKELLFFLVLAFMMIPGLTNLIPLYIMMSSLHLLNSYFVLVIMYSGWNIPFGIWLMRSFIEVIPRELDEAASIDGCPRISTFMRIIAPLSLPGLAATGIIVFINSWNEFLVALTFTTSNEIRTMPVGIYLFQNYYGVEWGMLMASAIVSCLAVVVFFLILQKRLIAGLTQGAVKL
jgi:multiple sugar transport system permease protein